MMPLENNKKIAHKTKPYKVTQQLIMKKKILK
jgi:hypothetical protein